MPAWGLSKCCSTKVFTVGARNPPRLPSAPITAIPLAAAAPLNSRVGRVQNKGCTVINPDAARQNARITSGKLPAYTLWNASVGRAWKLGGERQLHLSTGIQNLGNVRMQEESPNFGWAEQGRRFFVNARMDF